MDLFTIILSETRCCLWALLQCQIRTHDKASIRINLISVILYLPLRILGLYPIRISVKETNVPHLTIFRLRYWQDSIISLWTLTIWKIIVGPSIIRSMYRKCPSRHEIHNACCCAASHLAGKCGMRSLCCNEVFFP
jgi:hypothetical protein